MIKNALFINFQGIGNGIIIAPILHCFEKTFPSVNYYHVENKILSDKFFQNLAGIQNINGFIPSDWRRFNPDQTKLIYDFITKNNINLVVNLRNEGPDFDKNYYDFKRQMAGNKLKIAFWDLPFSPITKREVQNGIGDDIIEMLKIKGVNFSEYNSRWLSSQRKLNNNLIVGFGMAASQDNKRWPLDKWLELWKLILENNASVKLKLYPGTTDKEKDEVLSIADKFPNDRCQVYINDSLPALISDLGTTNCLISNDTGILHAGFALNIPTLGLYTVTDPNVWGYTGKDNFWSFVNKNIENCKGWKSHSGNCSHYYDTCPAVVGGDSILPTEVFKMYLKASSIFSV